MNRGNGKTPIAVLVVLVAATIVFIFAHSLQASAGSWADSNAVAALLEPVLRGVYGCFGGFLAKAAASPT